ncbi:MAG: isoprenylcysteine carboxylmethyltransferase family protein [Rhizobiaceae bacterium]|nr:isoprenylcysteine carboxylmethyltransferase family protein [Rhizobiaceae bacterium]
MSDRAKVKILPPIIPMTALAVGGGIHFLAPIEILNSNALQIVGISFVFISILIVAIAAKELSNAKTAFDVRKPSTSLVTSGIFRFSRNPTYLSMMLLCFGIALMANSASMLLTSIFAGSGLCLLVIRHEETYLENKFGEQYKSYQRAVRMWI